MFPRNDSAGILGKGVYEGMCARGARAYAPERREVVVVVVVVVDAWQSLAGARRAPGITRRRGAGNF